MIDQQLAGRAISDGRVLDAFRQVPREAFVPGDLREHAYDDAPLPIGDGQTISQPYIVALTIQELRLRGGERVLEVGTGSGFAAAVLARIAREVYTIERLSTLAGSAKERLAKLGCANVHVFCGDGSLGLAEHAPYDAIAVAAGGPKPPPALLVQLSIGGRLVMPIGEDVDSQVLVCITREGETEFSQEAITSVQFVPLVGDEAWDGHRGKSARPPPAAPPVPAGLTTLVREAAETVNDIETAPLDSLLERIGDARLVLLGEATHGTSEFYRMRSRITRELIARRGFSFVAVEADWPDAARIDDHVLGSPRRSRLEFTPFSRFPTWMWRNEEVHGFVDWLRSYNAENARRVGFHGLDLYSLFTSIAVVLAYLDEMDPKAAAVARQRYGALTAWRRDPAAYGEAVVVGRSESAERAVLAMLRDMLERRIDYAARDGERFFDASQNARLVADAEHYYRAMYYGFATSWNLRDSHMFETLRALFSFYGPESKGIVWEHNSHVGDASATEMTMRGEHNVGQLSRAAFGESAYIIGFGTDHGTVMAASDWERPMQCMQVLPAREGSYERVLHEAAIPALTLPLRRSRREPVIGELSQSRLERAIGVIYRPDDELRSHYFHATLPGQFDEYIWFDETHALHPLEAPAAGLVKELSETYPFGL
jgi:protein-L-isoaspartate(D-aspartate) O-methyltransferase